jgi:hypothetical protein
MNVNRRLVCEILLYQRAVFIAGRPVTEKAQNLLLESYANIGAVSSVMRLSGVRVICIQKRWYHGKQPFSSLYIKDEKGFLYIDKRI